ncbi:unnamed protein product [Caenorhabditis angaria]|uniref:Sulfotransferase domain-containing protein n=1 Tax=Caenorhabditis angaria TaxID=860376 RepID=A0A9P1J0N0_9PELO|nr:unnamed protein product [Caenorhabditis angaria]
MFSNLLAISRYISFFGYFFTLFTNILLIILTVWYIKRDFGTYKKLIVIFSIVGILFDTLDVAVKPLVHSINSGFIVFTPVVSNFISRQNFTRLLAIYGGSFYVSTITESKPEAFISKNLTFNQMWAEESICNDTMFFGFPDMDSQFTRLVFLRDPFERFISFYLDKCVQEKRCYDCEEEDLRCFTQRMYESLLKISKGQKLMYETGFNKEFYFDIHALPLSWCCDFLHYRKIYHILIIGSDLKDRQKPFSQLSDILRRKNVPQKYISKILKNTLKSETPHSTHKSSLRNQTVQKVKTDPIIREYLHKTYFNDYLVFPEFDRSHLDNEYQQKNGKWDQKYENEYENIIRMQNSFVKFKH